MNPTPPAVLILLVALLAMIYALGLWLLVWRGLWKGHRYRYDKRNPYRRWCRRCGQQQDEHCHRYAEGDSPGWWADVLPVPDPDCRCHRDAQ